MSKPIRHIAGPYTDLVQQCTRCLKILLDNRGGLGQVGMGLDGAPPPKYAEGAILIHWGDCTTLGDRPNAVDCEPMDVVEAFEHDEEQP